MPENALENQVIGIGVINLLLDTPLCLALVGSGDDCANLSHLQAQFQRAIE